ncbi:MAG: GNAT family N-acetyltransferase [Anaerolineae bacterium]|nr:GNAT family N-acetyltransferase [Anaerolineae bacterium]
MHELTPGQYGAVRGLFAPLWYHLVIDSAIEGHTPARIVADDPHDPTVAFVWDQVEGGYYLAGDPDNASFNRALNRLIHDEIYPEVQRRTDHAADLVVNYAPLAWERVLGEVLAGINVMRHARKHFLFREMRVPDWRDRVPDGYEMAPVDAAFLQRSDLPHMEDRILRWVRRAWGGIDGWLARGFGCCLLHGSAIVSWCTGDFAAGQACEMGIGTDAAYRRRGYATLTASATVEQCLARGLTEIGWHCWSANVASAATALAVGFRQTVEHHVLHAWYNEIDNWIVQGGMYLAGPEENTLQPVDWAAAASAYDRAMAIAETDPALADRTRLWRDPEIQPYILRNAARAHLHAGDLHAARDDVARAIAAGLPRDQVTALLEQEGFAHLRDSAAWRTLVDARPEPTP